MKNTLYLCQRNSIKPIFVAEQKCICLYKKVNIGYREVRNIRNCIVYINVIRYETACAYSLLFANASTAHYIVLPPIAASGALCARLVYFF